MPVVPPHRWTPPWTLRWVAPSLLILVVLGGWRISYSAQQGLAKIETELQVAVAAEPWLVAQKMNIQQPNARNGWQAQIRREAEHLRVLAESGGLVTSVQVLDLGKDWAAVQVVIQPTGGAAAFRQTRLYQQTPQGWTRLAPTAEHWGRPQELESRYFIFHYFSQDAAAVEEVADDLDNLYVALYTTFFPELPDNRKRVVQVDPAQVPGELTAHTPDNVSTTEAQAEEPLLRWNHLREQPVSPHALVVASPAATLVPAELTASDLLAQSLVLALLDNLTDQATRRYDLSAHWRPLRDGLRLWLLWDQNLPLAVWRQPVVRWIFWESPAATGPEAAHFLKLAHDLCASHHPWMVSPIEVRIPVSCLPPEGTKENTATWRYSSLLPLQTPLPLPLGPVSVQEDGHVRQVSQLPELVAVVVLATVVEYAVTTFGVDRMPILLAALPEHKRWETLIPAVFGVSVSEFETGWHASLAEHYGLKN
jgi:hypothetical protein